MPLTSDAGWKSKFLRAIDKALQNCTCHIVSETLKINYSPAVSVNTPMQNKSPVNVNTPMQNESPVNEFLVRVNMSDGLVSLHCTNAFG